MLAGSIVSRYLVSSRSSRRPPVRLMEPFSDGVSMATRRALARAAWRDCMAGVGPPGTAGGIGTSAPPAACGACGVWAASPVCTAGCDAGAWAASGVVCPGCVCSMRACSASLRCFSASIRGPATKYCQATRIANDRVIAISTLRLLFIRSVSAPRRARRSAGRVFARRPCCPYHACRPTGHRRLSPQWRFPDRPPDRRREPTGRRACR